MFSDFYPFESRIKSRQPIEIPSSTYQSWESKMLAPPLIQSLWIGNELSTMEKLSISSFLQNGHPFHLYVYDDVAGVPHGVEVKDASEIVPPSRIFKYKNRETYSGFSNMFRYKLLLENGGYWVDTDLVCFVPFQNDSEYIFSSEKTYRSFLPWKKKIHINVGVIKAPKGSEILEYCYSISLKRDPNALTFGDIGPKLMAAAVKKFGLEQHVADWYTYCPNTWWEWSLLIQDSTSNYVDEWMKHGSQAVHLWNEMWRLENIDKNSTFPKSSIFEELKRRYLDSK